MARGRGPVSDLISMTCRVDEVSGRTATVIDQFGIFRTVRTDVRRGMVRPREGEVWIIDRSLGLWTFSARVDDSEPPVVTGSTDQNPALISLLAALDLLGIIDRHAVACRTPPHPRGARALHPERWRPRPLAQRGLGVDRRGLGGPLMAEPAKPAARPAEGMR